MAKHERITIDPGMMGGQPCIRGMRMPVATVLKLIAQNLPTEEILADYPCLEAEDLQAALRYAADVMQFHERPQAIAS